MVLPKTQSPSLYLFLFISFLSLFSLLSQERERRGHTELWLRLYTELWIALYTELSTWLLR